MSCLINLTCSVCGADFDSHLVQTICENCQAPLWARYDLETIKNQVDRDSVRFRPRGMWRWSELLPVVQPENRITLGEGDTPLLPLRHVGADLGMPHVYAKEESLNPTGTFKARGLAAAVSKAKELGIEKLIIPTAGNAGGALAAYAAAASMKACVFMPKDSPYPNIEETVVMGAHVEFVDGSIADAAAKAKVKAQQEGWFDVSTFKEPYRVEGKKIMGYELAEALQWELPDVIIYPTGGGTGLIGMFKAFDEMERLGWLRSTRRPRMVAVQARGCAPVVKAFEAGQTSCEPWENPKTIASGLRVPKPFADRMILEVLRASHGTAIAVHDVNIIWAQGWLAKSEGVFAAPEGAATLAALFDLSRQGWIDPHEKVVLFNTGTGLKYPKIASLFTDPLNTSSVR